MKYESLLDVWVLSCKFEAEEGKFDFFTSVCVEQIMRRALDTDYNFSVLFIYIIYIHYTGWFKYDRDKL